MNFDTKLPQDVLFQILTNLPTESLVQLRYVSILFDYIISHPHFLNLHLSRPTLTHTHYLLCHESHHSIPKVYFSFIVSHNFSLSKHFDDPYKIETCTDDILVGCVRGLECLFNFVNNGPTCTLIFWNPFTGKFKILPSTEGFSSDIGETVFDCAVGFDHKNVDFIAVKILRNRDNESRVQTKALVYQLKIGSWMSIDSDVPCFMPKVLSRNVFVNGAVYWLACKSPNLNDLPNCIMGFDIVEEVFKVIDLPRNLGSGV